MDGDGTTNGVKLRRGRISLDRKREILEQYDLLSKPCSETDAAAIFGVSQATLVKILSERDEITEAAKKEAKKPAPVKIEVDSASGNPKLSRGRMSYEKQRELLKLYDELPKCSFSEAAAKLGVREVTLSKLLASGRSKNSGKRKRKKTPSSSESDDSSSDDSNFPQSRRAASTRDGSARLSPQPGGSGIGTPRGTTMALRKGRRVRVNYSEDEQSGSDYEQQDNDFDNDQEQDVEEKKSRKYHTPEERSAILSKYDSMQPCTQVYASKILGVTQSLLCSWLKQRNPNSKPKSRKSNAEDLDYAGEEIDSYVMAPKGSCKKVQVVQFFEVGAEDSNRSKSSNDSNSRKAHLSLQDRFEMLKKYDEMGPATLKDTAETFNIARSTLQNILANRYFFEKQFRAQLREEMGILKEYDAIENKQMAPRALGMTRQKLEKLLASRGNVEKYYNELIASNEDGESIAHSGDETESRWKDSKELKALEVELLHWFQQANNERTVNLKDLKEKAKELASEFQMEDFNPSDSWLKRWNRTYGVFWNQRGKLVAVYGFGENRSVSECVLMALKVHPPENVFNLVETGLYYKAVPGCSPSTDDWVVVAFACNMAGTEKKKLLVVGKSEAPLCFRVMSLPLTYKHSANACMSEHVVSEYLEAWDRELATEGRKIALVLDTSSSHPNVPLSRIQLFFVPADCSGEQPLSRGVVAQAKSLYRQRMAESLQSSAYSSADSITIVDALFALAQAWNKVPKALLVSKFLSSTFPQNDDARTELDTKELEILNKLDDNIRLHSDGLPNFGDGETELEGGRVVHMEGTLHLSEEEEEDFDIDSLLRDQDTAEFDAPRSAPDLGSKLKNFLGKTSTPNGSAKGDSEGTPPTVSDVRAALATIKNFLHHNGGTLEDLTDYTQLEIKVLSKIIKPEPKLS